MCCMAATQLQEEHAHHGDDPAEDPATYWVIQRADTLGVFQSTSRAQMAILPRHLPANF